MSEDIVTRLRRWVVGPETAEIADEIEATIATLRADKERLERDAARYRWLRDQDWFESPICCVANPKSAVRPGHDCPSRYRLDNAIDAAMKEQP